jgi:ribosomal-protein-alanine N-acetyltransferase
MASGSYDQRLGLATARLALRPFAPADRLRLHTIFRDPYVRRYLWDSKLVSLASVDEVIAASEACFRAHGMGLWCAVEAGAHTAHETIGFAGLRCASGPEFELIYGFLPAHWGRGFASECAHALMVDGFARGLARIWAGTDLENKASERVMRRLGMRFDRRETVGGLPQVWYVIERGGYRA